MKIYDAPHAAYVLNEANWELSLHQDPSECDGLLMSGLFPDTYGDVTDSVLPAPMLVGTGSFSGGSIVSFPFTPAQVGETFLTLATRTFCLPRLRRAPPARVRQIPFRRQRRRPRRLRVRRRRRRRPPRRARRRAPPVHSQSTPDRTICSSGIRLRRSHRSARRYFIRGPSRASFHR